MASATRVEVETQKLGRNETWTFEGLFPGFTRVDEKPGKSTQQLFRFSGNGPGRRTACFCFCSGNETPGFPRFLSSSVSIQPPEEEGP